MALNTFEANTTRRVKYAILYDVARVLSLLPTARRRRAWGLLRGGVSQLLNITHMYLRESMFVVRCLWAHGKYAYINGQRLRSPFIMMAMMATQWLWW